MNNTETKLLAIVRKDLQKKELSVPVGEGHYSGSEPLEYRWIGEDEDQFQVLLDGKWQDAESIDWDFL